MGVLLGPEGGTRLIDGSTEGIDMEVVIRTWEDAFAPAEVGGCPEAYAEDGMLRRNEPTVAEMVRQALYG